MREPTYKRKNERLYLKASHKYWIPVKRIVALASDHYLVQTLTEEEYTDEERTQLRLVGWKYSALYKAFEHDQITKERLLQSQTHVRWENLQRFKREHKQNWKSKCLQKMMNNTRRRLQKSSGCRLMSRLVAEEDRVASMA